MWYHITAIKRTEKAIWKKYRKLKNGGKAEELDSPINLIIKTKCPTKWIIEDLETGQRYKANGHTEVGKMFDLIYNKK